MTQIDNVAKTNLPAKSQAAGAGAGFIRSNAAQVTSSKTTASSLTPVPAFPRRAAEKPIFEARLPANLAHEKGLFSENKVPFNSIVLNISSEYDVTQPKYIAQAALKVNPAIQFIIPTQKNFTSASDTNFIQERKKIADQLGVPEKNIIPVRAHSGLFPQDEFMAGKDGLSKPQANLDIDGYKRTQFGVNELASELGLKVNKSPFTARGGDTHIITKPNGEKFAYFSYETIKYTAKSHGIDLEEKNPKNILKALAVTMKNISSTGVNPKNIMPIGSSPPSIIHARTYGEMLDSLEASQLPVDFRNRLNNYFNDKGYPSLPPGTEPTSGRRLDTLSPDQRKEIGLDFFRTLDKLKAEQVKSGVESSTYGGVLKQMSDNELAQIDPDVLQQLHKMKHLPLPTYPYTYHTDVLMFTPNGKDAFLSENSKKEPQLEQQLKFFGFKPVYMPSGKMISTAEEKLRKLNNTFDPHDMIVNDNLVGNGKGNVYIGYTNMVQGKTSDNKHAILMPTEAKDPNDLTPRDKEVMAKLKEAMPDAVIIPVGGHSALTGRTAVSSGVIGKDWGIHCMSNVLPYIIEQKP